MANHEVKNPRVFEDAVRMFETTDRGHADVFNDPVGKLVNNDAYLFERVDAIQVSEKKHFTKSINDQEGVHGFRLLNEVLQFYNKETDSWIDIETIGSGIAPSDVITHKVKVGNAKLTLYWEDPRDTTIDGQTICTWKGTKLVQKVGAYPQNIKDGTVLVDNQVKDTYKTNGFIISGLTNGTTYYFALFPYSDKNIVNENVVNRVAGTPLPYKKMTVNIDLSNSNPSTCINYADDATEMTAGSSAWDEFFGYYPTLLKDGTEVGKLKISNFTQFENGSIADITSGNGGDVMIAFPRRGINITTVENKLTISITDDPDNDDFEYLAHTRGSTQKEKFYLGAYKGNTISSKLRSLSGKIPTPSQNIGTFRTQAQANGSGYEQSGFYQLTFIQVMYLLKYKNLNSQTTVGRGYVDGNSTVIATGGTNVKGMNFGETTGRIQMKLFGLEDFWGNISEWIDGVKINDIGNILTATTDFNDAGVGYTEHVANWPGTGYMSKPQGDTKKGFIGKETAGSETTYFCDMIDMGRGAVANFGGTYGNKSLTGIFRIFFTYGATNYENYIGARLMYL